MIYTAVIDSPVGQIDLRVYNDTVVEVNFLALHRSEQIASNNVLMQAVAQMRAYFIDPHTIFSVPLALHGTVFQCRVWNFLQQIPAGQVLTYGAIARQLNSSPRAIGGACRANPLPLFVPCHRVIASNGIGGYFGTTIDKNKLAIKNWLLQHEGAVY